MKETTLSHNLDYSIINLLNKFTMKSVTTIISLVLTLCIISLTSCAGEYMRISGFTADDGIRYSILDEKTVAVSGYSDYSENIVIPATVEYQAKTYTVVGIKRSAFYGCTWLETINLPKTLESIDMSAFIGCEKITRITIQATIPPTLEGEVFEESVYQNATLIVPYSTIYKEEWPKFQHIVDQQ